MTNTISISQTQHKHADTQQERVDVAAITMRLAELCPKLIFVYEGRRRPLQIGIRDQILERVAGSITPEELKLALRAYTRNAGYLRAMAQPGAMRIDIEGNPVDAVTPAQSASAAKAVAAHWARQAARKKARQAEARPPCSDGSAGGTVKVRLTKRLGLADLKQAALARRA
jgi:sRNA-binding protein